MKLAYNLVEACLALGIGRETLSVLIREGYLDALQIGPRTVISAASLESLLKDAEDFAVLDEIDLDEDDAEDEPKTKKAKTKMAKDES